MNTQKIPENISFPNDPAKAIKDLIADLNPDKVAVLVDENTREKCLDLLKLPHHYPVIQIESGELNKNLTTCTRIWKTLTDEKFTRKSLLVNLGGGVIGDLGGFVAATYKRGIRFINIPTTLLAQVDASIGGKLGIDFEGLKNHIGIFRIPDHILIFEGFLKTLPSRELKSGFAEVIKHGLIWDQEYWNTVRSIDLDQSIDWLPIIKRSVEIKNEVVMADPLEHGLRKILNFGHTIGHAIETWHLDNGKSLLHGEAIAAGMITEGFLSKNIGLLDEELEDLISTVKSLYQKIQLPRFEDLQRLMIQDKKNEAAHINFSLLKSTGLCKYNEHASEEEIKLAMDSYLKV